jgi:hypothetical protein
MCSGFLKSASRLVLPSGILFLYAATTFLLYDLGFTTFFRLSSEGFNKESFVLWCIIGEVEPSFKEFLDSLAGMCF